MAAEKNAINIIIIVSGRPRAKPIIKTTIPSPYPRACFVSMPISKKHNPGRQLESIWEADGVRDSFAIVIIIEKYNAIFLEMVRVRMSIMADHIKYNKSDPCKIRLNVLVIFYFPFKQCLQILLSCVCGE